MALEILNRAFVFLRSSLCIERSEISSFPGLRIFLSRVQPILAGFQFPDHVDSSALRMYANLALVTATEYSQRVRKLRVEL
jgi:hypothetical protein